MGYSPKSFLLFVTYVVVLCLCSSVAAEDAKPERRRLPKSGMLAVSSISGAGTSVVSDLFGAEDIFGKELPPISGSVSRRGESAWHFSVMNNSKDRYSVNLDLVQKNESGSTVKLSSYSYTLGPGQSDGEEVAAGFAARRAELTLRSYRNLTEQAEARKKKE